MFLPNNTLKTQLYDMGSFLTIKYSFFRLNNTKFIFSINQELLNDTASNKSSLLIGIENFLNKNVSISTNIGISYSYKTFANNYLSLLDYNFKAYYYF